MTDEAYEELGPQHNHGDKVCWTQLNGESFRGTLMDWDNGSALVRCTDGKVRTVKGC